MKLNSTVFTDITRVRLSSVVCACFGRKTRASVCRILNFHWLLTRFLKVQLAGVFRFNSPLGLKKIKRRIGILSKLRYFLSIKTLLSLYYALVEPFLNYCIIAWGNTYQTTLQPLFILQKRALRIISFSSYNEHSRPLFKDLNVVKLSDIITFQLAVFMYKFHNNLLPYIIIIPDYLAK